MAGTDIQWQEPGHSHTLPTKHQTQSYYHRHHTMAILPLPTLPLTVAPTPTAANFDDLNDVMLPPDTLSKRSSMAPHKLFAMDYDQCHGIPPIVFNNPPNKRKGGRGNGAVLSPVRKKKPPPSLPARSQQGSVFIAAAVSFATAK